MHKIISRLIQIFVSLAILNACTSPSPQPTGTLQGHVSIGPLVPVQREGVPDPTPAPEVYAARLIIVYSEDGDDEIAKIRIDAEGNYRIELPVGLYLVDIEHTGIDRAAGLPKTVNILVGQKTFLDIDIDTGMR